MLEKVPSRHAVAQQRGGAVPIETHCGGLWGGGPDSLRSPACHAARVRWDNDARRVSRLQPSVVHGGNPVLPLWDGVCTERENRYEYSWAPAPVCGTHPETRQSLRGAVQHVLVHRHLLAAASQETKKTRHHQRRGDGRVFEEAKVEKEYSTTCKNTIYIFLSFIFLTITNWAFSGSPSYSLTPW